MKLEQLDGIFEEMSDRARNLSPIGKDLADIMRDDARKRFASAPATEIGGNVYGGVYWPALTDASFAMNPKRHGGKIGVDTGELRRQATLDGVANLYKVSGTDFTFELTSEKAQEFQVDRPLVFWHVELLRRVSDRLVQYFQDALG